VDDVAQPQDVCLTTARLILREFREDDWRAAHAYRSDPEVARFMLTHQPEGSEQTRSWLDAVIRQRQRQPRDRYTLAIALRPGGHLIGQISLGRSDEHPADGEVGFGYMLRRDSWGRGYASEAALAIVAFAFGSLGTAQVSAWCFEANRASARVLEKAGLRLALREADVWPKTGEPGFSLKYTVRREEWRSIPGR
jgi:RimJ/RimL family protein N-acetyltransferase